MSTNTVASGLTTAEAALLTDLHTTLAATSSTAEKIRILELMNDVIERASKREESERKRAFEHEESEGQRVFEREQSDRQRAFEHDEAERQNEESNRQRAFERDEA